jgi:hypothetical protein
MSEMIYCHENAAEICGLNRNDMDEVFDSLGEIAPLPLRDTTHDYEFHFTIILAAHYGYYGPWALAE